MIDYKVYEKQVSDLDSKYFPKSFSSDLVNYYNVHRPKWLVKKLQKRVENFNIDIIPKIINYALSDKAISYKVLPFSGTGHIICFVNTAKNGELVVRANEFLDEPEMYMEYESDFLNIYEELRIPVNDLLFADCSRSVFEFDFQVMSRLDGRDLGADWEGSEVDYYSITKEQGRCIARMYGYKGNGWGRMKKVNNDLIGVYSSHNDFLTAYLDHDLEFISLFGLLTQNEATMIYDYFKSNSIINLFKDSTSHLLHNDPSDLNLRYIKNKFLGYFDWENAVMFDPINEIGTAPTWKSAYPKEDALIEGFIEELGYTPKNLKKKMNVYFLRKIIDKVAFALKGERLSQRHVNIFLEGIRKNDLDLNPKYLQNLKFE